MKRILIFWLLLASLSEAKSQYKLIGDAQYMKGGCIMLTPDLPYREGIAYYSTKLNLSSYFEIQFDIYLGKKDEYGADGITFVLHDDNRQFEAFGTFGECLGYGRWNPEIPYGTYIAPSVAIEFDTYQNPTQNDPFSDHVAFLQNGSNYHQTFWNDGDMEFDLEDDKLHSFSFRWEPEVRQLTVILDNQVVYSGQHDLVNEVFNGQQEVIWGWTASTGRKYNLQYFCLKRIAYRDQQKDNRIFPILADIEK